MMMEQECGLSSSVEDYQEEFKFGLAEVVYQWALGTVRHPISLGHQSWYLCIWIITSLAMQDGLCACVCVCV